jgi:hypothetical protein
MDAQVLTHINTLLDRDVDLREVSLERLELMPDFLESPSAQKLKEQVTELDKKTRTMAGVLNKIHSTPSDSSQICSGCYF